MNKLTTTVLLVVALGAGWLLGSLSSGEGGGTPEQARLQAENTRLRRALGERGPVLRPQVGGLKGRGGNDDPQGDGPAPASDPGPIPDRVESYDIRTFADADRAFQTLVAYARTMLTRGPEGHLALLATIDDALFDDPGKDVAERLVGGREGQARFLYALVRFATNHDAEIVDMTETVFRTMAEDPQRLADIDNDSLEVFTEGVAPMLPGMVAPDRLDRFRAHARAVLDAPEKDQPRTVRQQRADLLRALESWAPALSKQEILDRLRAGGASPEETISMLRRLDPAAVAQLDLDRILGPLLASHGWKVVSLLGRMRPDADLVARFDARVLEVVSAGNMSQSVLSYWLKITQRRTWERARPFLEAGLQQAGRETAGVFLLTALDLEPPPDEAWVRWAEQTYAFSERVRVFLKNRRARK